MHPIEPYHKEMLGRAYLKRPTITLHNDTPHNKVTGM